MTYGLRVSRGEVKRGGLWPPLFAFRAPRSNPGWWWPCLVVLLVLSLLFRDLLQLAGEAADEAAHRRREAGERGGDHADEAAVEHLARRQLRDRVDLVRRERGAVHPAA